MNKQQLLDYLKKAIKMVDESEKKPFGESLSYLKGYLQGGIEMLEMEGRVV